MASIEDILAKAKPRDAHHDGALAEQMKALREQARASEVPFLLRYIGDKA